MVFPYLVMNYYHPTGEAHVCICGARYSLRNSLLVHIRRVHHHRDDTERPRCQHCCKTFNSKSTFEEEKKTNLVTLKRCDDISCVTRA